MSREIENYLCTSEDRVHYDTEDNFPFGFYLIKRIQNHVHKDPPKHRESHYPDGYVPMIDTPHVTTITITNKTEVIEEVSDERIQSVIDDYIPNIQENITQDVINEINETVIPDLMTEDIDEIYGGSATDVIKEFETP